MDNKISTIKAAYMLEQKLILNVHNNFFKFIKLYSSTIVFLNHIIYQAVRFWKNDILMIACTINVLNTK